MLDIMYDYLLAHYFAKIIYIVSSDISPVPSHPSQAHTHTPLFVILILY